MMPHNSEVKKFGGKPYQFAYYRHDKKDAQGEARSERKHGFNARVVKTKIGEKTYYDIYVRRKRG